MDKYGDMYNKYVQISYRLNFFNSCKAKKIIPGGLVVEKHLATHVNDIVFIEEFKQNLNESSSRGLDLVIERFQKSKIELEEKLDELCDNLKISNDRKFYTIGEMKVKNIGLKAKLANKLEVRVQQVQEARNKTFRSSGGSRRVRGDEYIPRKNCQCCPNRIRPHRKGRRGRAKVVKEGPANETLKDIIEEEQSKRDPINLSDFVLTEDMKKVLRLGATFAPTPTKPIDLYGLYVDFNKWADRLRWHYFHNHKHPENDDNFVKKPWYEPTGRKAPRANDALEAFIFKVHEEVFDPEKRRKINDNLSVGERKALKELMDLVATHGVIVRFEDKGSRFVIDTLANHDETIREDLNDITQYDKLANNPIDSVKLRIERFAEQWKVDLDEFHPNVRQWITNLVETKPGKAKGLVKCHKPSLPNGKKPYRLLLCGTNTPVQPLSKLVQDAIQHLVPTLKYKARDTKEIHQIIIKLNQSWQNIGGLPASAKQVCADVRKLYPSVDNTMGIPAVRRKLEENPNPEGLPTDLIIEALQICLEENFCEFCGEHFKVNSGTAMGPCHSCDYADCFMAELDDKLVEELRIENIEHTQWTIFRDDGWDILENADDDLPKFEEILDGLHPNINWDVRTSDEETSHALEHLDLTIYIQEGKIETDNYAKDIPIFLSRKSCHPSHVFKSVIKSTAFRLNQNCSLDEFLWKRKVEYSRYFYASFYKPKEVKKVMDEVTGITKDENGNIVQGEARKNREKIIFRPRKSRQDPANKKFVFVSDWEPRNPDISNILRKNKYTLFRDPVNRRLFPEGSVIAGFRRRRNLGEMVCPTNPSRVPRPPQLSGTERGCGPCGANRCQIHQNIMTCNKVVSPWDSRPRQIYKKLSCATPNVVYYFKCTQCPGPGVPHYTGSTVEFKQRWRKHKSDMTRLVGKDCNFCEHWSRYHRDNPTDFSGVEIYLLDKVEDAGRKEDGYPNLRKLEDKWMVNMGSLGTIDPIQGCNKKDDAAAKAWGT